MKLWLQTTVFFTLLLPGIIFAQSNIAVIDIEAAAINSNYAKSSIAKLKDSETFKKNLEQYNLMGKEFQALQEEGKTNGLTWSDEQKKTHRKKLEIKVAELNKVGGRLDAEKAAVEARIQKELTPKIEEIVPKIIKEKQIGLLINARAAYFRTPDFDITKELINRLNKLQEKQ
ncbi:MAG: OmpH family outer membrane protein [Cellvibrionaceae bacterium]